MKIRALFSCTLALLAIWGLSHCSNPKPVAPLPTGPRVNLKRYVGHWYEQFRLPNSFQNDRATAEADYALLPDGAVRVVNTETRPDGTQKTAKGTAQAIPDGNNNRLRVKFEGIAALVPAAEEGNYWILKLDPDYSTVLVGTPDREFLWMLSRAKGVSEARRAEYVKEAQRLGFDTSKLIYRRR